MVPTMHIMSYLPAHRDLQGHSSRTACTHIADALPPLVKHLIFCSKWLSDGIGIELLKCMCWWVQCVRVCVCAHSPKYTLIMQVVKKCLSLEYINRGNRESFSLTVNLPPFFSSKLSFHSDSPGSASTPHQSCISVAFCAQFDMFFMTKTSPMQVNEESKRQSIPAF